jgi:hypothetical protein
MVARRGIGICRSTTNLATTDLSPSPSGMNMGQGEGLDSIADWVSSVFSGLSSVATTLTRPLSKGEERRPLNLKPCYIFSLTS